MAVRSGLGTPVESAGLQTPEDLLFPLWVPMRRFYACFSEYAFGTASLTGGLAARQLADVTPLISKSSLGLVAKSRENSVFGD